MSPANAGPLPPTPTMVTIPLFNVRSTPAGTMEVPASTGFYYAGVQSIWLWWLMDLPVLTSFLEPYDITPYDFGGKLAGSPGAQRQRRSPAVQQRSEGVIGGSIHRSSARG